MTFQTYEDQSSRDEYPEHQLVPQRGGMYTHVFHGPPGTDVGDLHCNVNVDEDGHVVNSSGWKPDEEQIAQLESGAHIRVALWAHPIPPLAVSVEPPVCGCHGEPMVFDRDEVGYFCAKVSTTGRHPANNHVSEGDANLEAARRAFTPAPLDPEAD